MALHKGTRSLTPLIIVAIALRAAPAAADPQLVVADPIGAVTHHGIGLDLALAGGLRVHAGDGDDTRSWFARARVGVSLINEPTFLSLGVAAQISPLDSKSLGIELNYSEVFHATFAQVGLFPLDTAGGTSFEAAVGWTVVGLEYQRRLSGSRDGDQVLLATVQVPIGLIYTMLHDPPGVVRH